MVMRIFVAHGSAIHPSKVLPVVLEHVTSKHGIKLKETREVQFAPKELMLSIWVNGIICA